SSFVWGVRAAVRVSWSAELLRRETDSQTVVSPTQQPAWSSSSLSRCVHLFSSFRRSVGGGALSAARLLSSCRQGWGLLSGLSRSVAVAGMELIDFQSISEWMRARLTLLASLLSFTPRKPPSRGR